MRALISGAATTRIGLFVESIDARVDARLDFFARQAGRNGFPDLERDDSGSFYKAVPLPDAATVNRDRHDREVERLV